MRFQHKEKLFHLPTADQLKDKQEQERMKG